MSSTSTDRGVCPVRQSQSPPRRRAPRRRQLLPQRLAPGRERRRRRRRRRCRAAVEARGVDGTETGPAARQLDGRTPGRSSCQ